MIKAKLWPSHRSLSWSIKALAQCTTETWVRGSSLLYQLQFCRILSQTGELPVPKVTKIFGEGWGDTCAVCWGKTQGSWLAAAWRPWTSIVIQCYILALSPSSPWLFHLCFARSADKAISLYAMQTYPKWLQGRLVPLSPASGGKAHKSIREPNSNGWCLWVSGIVKLWTVVQPALWCNSFFVYQQITAGRTATESVQGPCHSVGVWHGSCGARNH